MTTVDSDAVASTVLGLIAELEQQADAGGATGSRSDGAIAAYERLHTAGLATPPPAPDPPVDGG